MKNKIILKKTKGKKRLLENIIDITVLARIVQALSFVNLIGRYV